MTASLFSHARSAYFLSFDSILLMLLTSIGRWSSILVQLICLGGLLLVLGCDPTVEVVEPSEQYRYSLYGALNVAADTQAIRVEALDDTIQLGAPPEIDATVTLENLDTGTQVTLRDSFIALGAGNNPTHNFWTTHPIEPATSYRIAVDQGGEVLTSATTIIPANPPELSQTSSFFLPCGEQNFFSFVVRNVEHIAAAKVIYPITYVFQGESPRQTLNEFDYSESIRPRGDDFSIFVRYAPALEELNPNPGPGQSCISREYFTHPYVLMVVASGGPTWPDWRRLPLDAIARPDSFSNVKGGHGFVGGVYSDTVKVPILERSSAAQ